MIECESNVVNVMGGAAEPKLRLNGEESQGLHSRGMEDSWHWHGAKAKLLHSAH
jgi:hypothetical protein